MNTIEILYSEEDEGYIAVVPELPGCSAFGETEEEALKEIKVAIKLWIEAAKKEGRKIPKPMGKELLKTVMEKQGQQKKKLWMAIELEEIKKYDELIKPKRFISVSGQYLRE